MTRPPVSADFRPVHHIEAATRFAPLEVWEQKNPWLMERCELAGDSGGGYGSRSERDPEGVRSDLREGYVSEDAARGDSHAFDS